MNKISKTDRAQIVLWLGQYGVTVTPCTKTDTIMLYCQETEWVDVVEYDWSALYEQCKQWNLTRESGAFLPWQSEE